MPPLRLALDAGLLHTPRLDPPLEEYWTHLAEGAKSGRAEQGGDDLYEQVRHLGRTARSGGTPDGTVDAVGAEAVDDGEGVLHEEAFLGERSDGRL
jgi:hypothetical protein